MGFFDKILAISLSAMLSLGQVGCEEKKHSSTEVNPVVIIEMESGDKMKVKLDSEAAPITVANFTKLVSEGFYDGLTFHRIEPGFVIQGGDPKGDGTGGSETKIKGEFSSNGVENPIKHTRGVISMARSNDKNGASSQFFLMHQDAPHLDGNYAAFGEIIEGIEVVDKIAANPSVKPVIKQMTLEKTD